MPDPIFLLEDFISFSEFKTTLIELEENDRKVLQCFIEYPGIWAYRIYKDTRKFLGASVSGKTVKRSVRRLKNKELIGEYEKEKEKEYCFIRHTGKILSKGGIYCLLLSGLAYPVVNFWMMSDRIFKALLNNYSENILFQIFLYPYLKKDTLLAIQDSNLLSQIYIYLYQCCVDIGNLSWVSNKNQYTTQEIFIWEDVPDNKIETKRLFNFLERRFSLSWLNNSQINKSKDKNSIWIRHSANNVSIKLDKDKKNATMKIRDNKKEQEYELIIKQFKPDFLSVRMAMMSVKENMAHHLLIITQQRVPGFILDMASKVVAGSTDFELLSSDEKFLHALRVK